MKLESMLTGGGVKSLLWYLVVHHTGTVQSEFFSITTQITQAAATAIKRVIDGLLYQNHEHGIIP